MKKKTIFGILLALIILLVPTTVASAMDNSVTVELDEIVIDGETYADKTATFTSKATVTFGAEWVSAGWNWEAAYAYAELTISNGSSTITLANDDDYINSILDGAIYPDTVIEIPLYGEYTFDASQEGYGWQVDAFTFGEYEYGTGWWYSDGTYNQTIKSKAFGVGAPHPELYFRLTALGADGQTSYESGDMTPMPTQSRIDCIGRNFTGDNNFYRFVVPKGTVITDTNGSKSLCLYINDINGNTLSSTFRSATFSNPVEVYIGSGDFYRDQYNNWAGGTWTLMGTFSEVTDYTATIE